MSFVNIFDNKGVVKHTEELKKLLQEVKQCDCENKRESIVKQVVSLSMRSRLLCRRYKNQPLAGVYKDIYQQVCVRMSDLIIKEVSKPNFESAMTYEWLIEIQLQTFKEVLNDARLKQLALSAQNKPPNSALRSYALENLIKAIEISHRLCRPYQKLFSSNSYPLIYEEAVSKTMIYICLKIDQYDPQRGSKKFMNWVNFKLDKTILSYYQKSKNNPVGKPLYLTNIDIIPQKKMQPSKADLLYNCIEKDSQGIFKRSYITDNPKANFREIALRKLSNKTLKEIAEELNVNPPTMYAFYKRNCEKFVSLLKQEIEQQIDSF